MNKENEFPSLRTPTQKPESLTPEQRARISLKFRAAKALLARKRPRLSTTPLHPSRPKEPHKVDVHNSSSFLKGERTPLKDLHLNVDSQVASKGSGLRYDEYGTTSLTCNSVDKVCDSATKESNVSYKDENLFTPMSSHEKRFDCSSTSNCSLISTVFNEEFDESLLEEIDSLCDRSSIKKLERKVDIEENGIQKRKLLESPQGIQDQIMQTGDRDIKHAKESPNMPENYSNYMDKLNQDQLEAASTDASTPLMVVAGPGSGKTSTMVGRVLMLLNQGIGSSHILAMTFTTAAASEMRDRIGAVAGKEIAKELTISTFHSFSLQLCRSHADKLGRTSEFLIYGHGQQRRAVVEAIRLLESEKDKQTLDACDTSGSTDDIKIINFKERSQKWQKFVTQAKASGKTPEECSKEGDELGATLLKNYYDILSSCDALDYHDLISCSVKLLSDYPEVFEECQTSWKAIIVDEFQDTSAMQYRLLRLLSSHGRITVVGDDDQSIFSFNGADISGFDSFRQDFPHHKEVRLKKNYRSTRCIVEAAASLIKHNVKRCQLKQVLTDNSSGSKITLKECRSEDAQCAYVVDKILETVSNSMDTECSFGNISILYRRSLVDVSS